MLLDSSLPPIQRPYNPNLRRYTCLYRLESPRPPPAQVTPPAQPDATNHNKLPLSSTLPPSLSSSFTSPPLPSAPPLPFRPRLFSSSFTPSSLKSHLHTPLPSLLHSSPHPSLTPSPLPHFLSSFFSIFLLSFFLSSFIFSSVTISPSPPLPYPPNPPTAFHQNPHFPLFFLLLRVPLIILLPSRLVSVTPPFSNLLCLDHHYHHLHFLYNITLPVSHTHQHTHSTANVQRFQVSSFICCFTEDIVIPDKESSFTVSANSTTSIADSSF